MVAVILADRYSNQTIEKILLHYKKHEINNIVICQSSNVERIEEDDKNGQSIIVAKIGKYDKYLEQLQRIKNLIEENEFFITFGDNFCDVDLNNLYKFHKNSGRVASIATVKRENCLYNAGFMIFDTDIFDYITPKMKELEKDLLARIGQDDEISYYVYCGKAQNIFTKRKIYQIN